MGNCVCRFHVDDVSSAHVYLRLLKGFTIDNIPANVVEDCAQLVKANSISGEHWLYFPTHLAAPVVTEDARQQDEQRLRHLYSRLESEEERRHGRWPGRLPATEGGKLVLLFHSKTI